MSKSGSTSVVSRVFDAALSPESWPRALDAVAETMGAVDAAYIVTSKATPTSRGVRTKTLRTQLGSILSKGGVKRQIDLLRVLSTVTKLQET